MLDVGLPPARAGLGIDLRGLAGVLDYPARDMTITVQAGITLASCRPCWRTENQRLPIDVPRPEQATLGGALAVNVSGPHRYGFGTLRDYVIGISTVNDEGQEVKAGGRVVKNVAGYDLCKLHIGALGTLGIISQVTLKLRPLPEAARWSHSAARRRPWAALLDQLHADAHPPRLPRRAQQRGRPRHRRAGRDSAEREAPWVVVVGFEDNGDSGQLASAATAHRSGARADTCMGWKPRPATPAEPLWQALVEFRLQSETAA